MATEKKIQEAIQIGEKNKRTWELVKNWCAHATIEKSGGVGLVEQVYGLPIGHHFLGCPHAPAGGMAAWDLAEVALDFHDRNCVGCKFRKAVGFPNLSILLTERDQRRQKRKFEQEHAARARATELAVRDKTRQRLRASLDATTATTLDLISDLDRDRSKEAGERLLQTARLAPETFSPDIIDHLFALLDVTGQGLVAAALGALAQLPVDKERLCNAAMRSLNEARAVAVTIIQENCALADEALIAPALPTLIRMASPETHDFVQRQTVPVERPLWELYRQRAPAVRDGLRLLLGRREARNVSLAARGIRALWKHDPSLACFLTSEMVAKLARAKWLVEGEEEDVAKALREVRTTLMIAFNTDPNAVDRLVSDYLHGVSAEGSGELFKLYRDVLHRAQHPDDKETGPEDANRIAFRRLVAAATERQDDGAKVAAEAFYGDPYELSSIVVAEIDFLLGCAALIAERLGRLAKQPLDPSDQTAPWVRMELTNRLNALLDAYIRWACIAAGEAGHDAIQKVLTLLRGLPEDSEQLRAGIVGNFHRLARTTEALTLILPDYYSALVGGSQLVRAEAATALGDMRRTTLQNMPSLVFEAFTALLSDPYVIVHRSAIRALESFSLPEEHSAAAKRAIGMWISHYAQLRNNDRFLIEMIELYAHRYASDEKLAGALGNKLIEIAMTVPPQTIAQGGRRAMRIFAGNANYARFFLRLLDDQSSMSHHNEDLLKQLRQTPPLGLYQERSKAVEVGLKLARRHPYVVSSFLEALTLCGAWSDAAKLAADVHTAVDDTTQNKALRLRLNLYRIACAFEATIAEGTSDALSSLSEQWQTTLSDIRKDDEEHQVRRDPLGSFFGQD